jgi:tetratricopeptide (TPR) repeat protein
MARIARIFGCMVLCLPAPVSAKPLLTNSQDTYVTACIRADDSNTRLIEICSKALDQSGASDQQKTEMLNAMAWAHYWLDQKDKATADFEAILKIDPNSFDGLKGLGWLAYFDDDFTAAIQYFEQAMNRSINEVVLTGLGISLYGAGQIDLDKVLEYLDAALAIDPDYAYALREKAWFLEDADRLDEAAAVFGRALDIDSNDLYALYGMALVLSRQAIWEQALGFANRALEQDSDHMASLSRRSLILYNLNRPKQALKDAEKIVVARPDWAEGYVRKARALADLGRGQDAQDLLDTFDRRVGYNGFLVYWRAKLLFDDNQMTPSLKQIERVLAHDAPDFFDHLLHARITIALDDFAVARKAIEHALDLRPANKWALYYESLILIGEDRFDEAEAKFDAAIKADLPDAKLSDFLKRLVGKSQFLQSIQMRVRYRDRSAEQAVAAD